MGGSAGPLELFYDSSCGPCTFFARAFRGMSRTDFSVEPLDSPAADRALHDLSTEERFGAFHFRVGGHTYTGADAVPPLVESTFGPSAGRVSRNAAPVAWFLRRSYLWFWQQRQKRGCGAPRTS